MLNLNLVATAHCSGSPLFDILPSWYEFLPKTTSITGQCQPSLGSIADVWLIVAAIIEILLRVAALAAVVFVIYGGVMFSTSQGSPEQTSKARTTIINALIGLLLAVSASLLVGFLAVSIQ
jgi:ABC-type Fe3+ transport system permease subunit